MTRTIHTSLSFRPRQRTAPMGGAALIASMLIFSGGAFAQDDPATQGAGAIPPVDDPQMRSPFWGDDPYMGDRRPDDRRYRDRYDDEETFAGSFPVDLAALVAPARARYMALKWTYWTARGRLSDRVDELRRSMEDSEEYRDLMRQRDEAQRALDEARSAALAPLQDDPQYQALRDLERQLEEKIRLAHQSPQRDLDEIRAMSELAMGYGRQRREMEQGLTGTDSSISTARARLREIGQQQRDREEELARQVRNDEELALLRDQIQQLRIEYLAAGGYYDSAVRTADVAVDFAYFNALAHGGYASSYYNPYSPYGYGQGYGFGGFGFGRGGFIIGGISLDGGTGPVRLRPVLFPSPIISNTFRGVNQTPIPFIPTGNDPPPIPVPEE